MDDQRSLQMGANTYLRACLHMDDQDDFRDVGSGFVNQVGKGLGGL